MSYQRGMEASEAVVEVEAAAEVEQATSNMVEAETAMEAAED